MSDTVSFQLLREWSLLLNVPPGSVTEFQAVVARNLEANGLPPADLQAATYEPPRSCP